MTTSTIPPVRHSITVPASAARAARAFDGPERTRVDLEHRLFERHGDTGAHLHKQVGADTGRPAVIAGYVAATGA
jgi:hypothetical protein